MKWLPNPMALKLIVHEIADLKLSKIQEEQTIAAISYQKVQTTS